jgi:hypothetical protein
MFYRFVRSAEGYFYWTDENSLTINDYVRYLDYTSENESTEKEFSRRLSVICNSSLPANNSALWECLIGKQMIKGNDGELKLPVVFRVHHSVGDGVALLRLFLEALADKEELAIVDNPLLNQNKIETFNEIFMRFVVNVITILKSPSVLCTQMLKEIDLNRIHPTKLSGVKVMSFDIVCACII